MLKSTCAPSSDKDSPQLAEVATVLVVNELTVVGSRCAPCIYKAGTHPETSAAPPGRDVLCLLACLHSSSCGRGVRICDLSPPVPAEVHAMMLQEEVVSAEGCMLQSGLRPRLSCAKVD